MGPAIQTVPAAKTSPGQTVTASEDSAQIHKESEKAIVNVSRSVLPRIDTTCEKTNQDDNEHTSPPVKRRASVHFSPTVTRDGSVERAVHSRSNVIAHEAPIAESPHEFSFAHPSYTKPSRRRSFESETSSQMPPSRRQSFQTRPGQLRRNISFTTAQRAQSVASTWSYQSRIYQEVAKPNYHAEVELVQVSLTLLKLQKYALWILFIGLNAALIWVTFTHYNRLWWLILPILSVNTFSQVLMALMIIVAVCVTKLWRCCRRSKEVKRQEPEKLVMLLPCYNEDRNEMRSSINSLVRQVKIEDLSRIIMVVVDGNAKAPGEDVSTQEFLLNEFFAGGERTVFENGYIARDGQYMKVTIQEGKYQGVPYVVVAKARNQGKRDSLCFVRSFMWHFQNRSVDVATMFDTDLFDYLGSVLTDNGIDQVDYLTGMDGDTVFADDCTYELVKAIRRAGPSTVGVCGAVQVKFDDAPSGFFNKLSYYFWTHLQNAEYISTQGLRREFQSRVTGKVNCLPGCCQLIRVSEATFGDEVLRVKFGYVPKPNDMMMKQIMGVYSEDSLHASIIFSLFPTSRTAQALRARAYTTVPTSWKVYLSQRKRWALGSLCNESLMVFRPNILWIERITSIITIATWWIGPFIYSSVISFLISIARNGLRLLSDKLFAGLICVILFRYFYTFMIVTWFPEDWTARARFLAGFFMNLAISPLMNITVTVYSLWHCDEFSWGKTRMTAGGDVGHGGLSANVSRVQHSSPEMRMTDDIEAQSPSWQVREAYAIEKYSSKGPVLG